MYESHFGLGARPFGETVRTSAYLPLPSRDAVLRRLRYALTQTQGAAILFGPPGTGKTILARKLADELGSPHAILGFPVMSPIELLADLADQFAGAQVSASGTTMRAEYRRLASILGGSDGRGPRPLLVVDEAQSIADPAVFDLLRLLLNLENDGIPGLSMLLVGTTEALMKLPPNLEDRLSARCLLGPLDEAETTSYISGRLASAGSAASRFSPEAIAELHRAADGLPRRLNRLADLSMLIAYARESDVCDREIVAIAARELELDLAA